MKWLLVIAACGCGRGFFNPMPGSVDASNADASTGPPITYIQSSSVPSPGNINALTFPLPQREGDLEIVVVSWTSQANSIMVVGDSAGNSFASAIGANGTLNLTQSIFIACPIVASPAGTNLVSVMLELDTANTLAIAEYSNVDCNAPLDAVAGSAGGTSMAPTTGALTASHANDTLVVAASSDFALTGQISGYTQRIATTPFLLEDTHADTSGIFTAELPPGPDSNWVMQLLALRSD